MSEDTVHIYLKNPEFKENIIQDATASEKYLILQNDTLHHEKIELTKLIEELREEITMLETDNERMEQGKTYMGGIIKNCMELDKLRLQANENLHIMF